MDVIAILDVGKTNKKLILFDEHYRIVLEQTESFKETKDEDGDACEDLEQLMSWVEATIHGLAVQKDFHVKAINFSAYGASFVHIGKKGRPVAPLYNYLKPYPSEIQRRFYAKYNGEITFSMQTASPVLGSLNSGLQLYRIKELHPELFKRIQYSLHLPQFLSFLVMGKVCSDITSIGCHTGLWNFSQDHYHEWVYREGIIDKLAPVAPSDAVLPLRPEFGTMAAGIGLHDSSSAIIPYLASFREPFVLISTGTWCISMNPFNHVPLTVAELQQDCLCYLSYQGKPVKASRLFAGYEHEHQVRRLADYFLKEPDYHKGVLFDPAIAASLRSMDRPGSRPGSESFVFRQRDLDDFANYEAAYHRLLMDLMEAQIGSTQLVLQGTPVKRIFVDGGFGRNQVYMHLLASAFPDIEVFAASIPQATAMGAALAIHSHWNARPQPGDIIDLRYYRHEGR